jgi:hypothetical protein
VDTRGYSAVGCVEYRARSEIDFAAPVASVLAVDVEGVVRWVLKTLFAVPESLSVFVTYLRKPCKTAVDVVHRCQRNSCL